MFVDSLLQFSSAQDISGSSSVTSTNNVDLGITRNIGEGKPIWVVSAVTLVFTDGGSNAGTNVLLYGGATSGATTASQTLFQYPQAAAVGSGPYVAQIYPGLITTNPADYRYLQISYQTVTATLTQGKVTTEITTDIAAWVAYARGYTIS